MNARPPFIDAHLHMWDRGRLRYPWLDEADKASIAGTYLPADYRREAAAWNVVGAVHVEAGAHPGDAAAETGWLDGMAAADGLPDAIVAHVALDAPDVEAQLAFHAGHGRVRGVRHLVNWHPTDAARRAHSHDLTRDDAWRRGYALLARYGLSFDYHGFPPQLAGMAEVAALNPDTPVMVDHLALPIVADGLEMWRHGITRLAAMPHVSIKLSGAGFIGAPCADIVREVIDRFGTRRVMVATNFPTDRLFATMDETLGAYEALLVDFSEDERRDLWGRNANTLYRMGLTL
ncbi:amidohydrolase [Sphingomonas sp.]|uniref:amidohydrolase family protein n=1 Tax=Sphingomonas sp. TaxID=28214 RepID=UPI0035ADF8B7